VTDDDDSEDDPEPPRETPGAQLEAATAAPAPSPVVHKDSLKDAVHLVTGGKPDEALPMLYRLRAKSPRSAEIALWLGHAYFRKLWRTDALREYRTALLLRPQLRREALLIRNAVVGLEDPTYGLARVLLLKHVGVAALPELRRAARGSVNPRLRVRATLVGAQIARRRR
jgi:hypothetical protein